jgi:hypothetical protein
MNLHGIVGPLIGVVNPPKQITIQQATGYTTNPDGRQVPTYGAPVTVLGQFQDLSSKDLQQIAGLNIQGQTAKVYLPGSWQGVVRADRRGGDLLTIDGHTWLVVQVAESWPDWCAVIVNKQN